MERCRKEFMLIKKMHMIDKKMTKTAELRYAMGMAVAVFSLCTLSGCGDKKPDLATAVTKTAQYEQQTVTAPVSDSLGGEWVVIPLARSGEKVEDDYFEKYRANLEKRLKEQNGILSENRYTEYSRAVLAAKAIGEDPTDIGGFDIQAPLEDYEAVTAQGINGAVFALLALNADQADPNGELEQKYLAYILEQEKPDGGFSLDDSAELADVDITAMALQSLAAYQDEKQVKEVIKKGIKVLADAQDKDGGYVSYGDKSSESISQVILTLSTYGIDCETDERFQKNGKGLYDVLMDFYQKDGSFSHLTDGEADPMATDQGFCALVAYQRFKNGKSAFYDMTD